MARYIALIWEPRDDKRARNSRSLSNRLTSSPSGWSCIADSVGLKVFLHNATSGTNDIYALSDDAGVIIGKLFKRSELGHGRQSAISFDSEMTCAVLRSQGRHLSETFWGRYIAFLWDEAKQCHYIFRDPTGALPCVYTAALDVFVFVSHLSDLITLGIGKFDINWRHVTAQFWNMRLITKETGFHEVSHVYAGERITINANGVAGTFLWEPVAACDADTIEEPNEAREALKFAIHSCVQSWASCYRSIIHTLSGGLDSSIVASCLGAVPGEPDIACVNLRTEAKEGNELHFAELAAHRAGFQLLEGEWNSKGVDLESLLDTRKHATPSMTTVYSEADRLLRHLAKERGAEAVFSGEGGDHLFQHQRSPRIAADFIWRHGVQSGLAGTVADTSRFTRKPIWSILATAALYGLLRRRFDPYSRYARSPLLTEDAMAGLLPGTIAHPWVEAARGVPPSKLEQIELLVDSQHFYLRTSPGLTAIHPLLSQPIIEQCLQIPTYVLIRGGVSRGLVREAFSNDLPPEIAARTTKGTTSNYLSRLMTENVDFVRQYLLDGILVSAQVLDRIRLEAQLSERALVHGSRLFDLFTALRVETWLRSWEGAWAVKGVTAAQRE